MKRTGILHAQLAGALAGLGHTQTVTVADCGLPIPAEVALVDLALVHGVPQFGQVLDALLDELVIEGHVYAEEAVGTSGGGLVSARADRMGVGRTVPHEELKRMVAGSSLVVRTGEDTPYANVILRCGVPF